MSEHVNQLEDMKACQEAIDFASNYPTIQAAWDACERGDWLLWFAGKRSGGLGSEGRKKLVLAACECARLALPYVKKGENRPLTAIQAAEDWANGKKGVSLGNVRAAAHAADAAAYAASDAAHAAYATYAAAYAADAAYATYAANVAYAASDAAHAAHAAERKKTHKLCADIVRKHYPTPPDLEIEEFPK